MSREQQFTDEALCAALAHLAAGASLSEVGRMFGVTHTTVARWRAGKFCSDALKAAS